MSIVFDRAVEYYDQTRALPAERHQAMVEALVRETGMDRNSRVLEIGIGTGRIGMSVAEKVNRVFGIDLSTEMMGVLRRKLAVSYANIDLAQADARDLPFGDNTFDVAYAVHVYHLVHGWREAMLDARRVLKHGGHFVVSFHKRNDETPNARLRKQLKERIRAHGIDNKRPGSESEDEILEEIKTWDANPRLVVSSVWNEPEVPEKILHELDRQIFSETWAIPREVLDAVTPGLREWAIDMYGDLSQPIEVTNEARWLIARKE